MSLDAPVHLNMHRLLSQSLTEWKDVWFSLPQRTLHSCWGEQCRGTTNLTLPGSLLLLQGKGEVGSTQAWEDTEGGNPQSGLGAWWCPHSKAVCFHLPDPVLLCDTMGV